MLSVVFFPIFFTILYWYLPVFEATSSYKILELYKDKIIINKKEEFLLDKIKCDIKIVHKGHRLISASWVSCIFYYDDKVVAEFIFSIDTNKNILNATPQSICQIIHDLQKNQEYDFQSKITTEYQKYLQERKRYDYLILFLILLFIIPASIGVYFLIVDS